MTSVLFSRPKHDVVTYYLFLFSRELIGLAKIKHDCINIEGPDATRSKVTSLIKGKNPEFVMFNGHGNTDIVCGHKNDVLIKKDENHDILKGKIVYSLSCNSAAELGPASVDAGAIAFIGYMDEFALGTDARCEASPYRDKRAKLFLEPSNLLVKCLLKGSTVDEAIKRTKDLMRKNLSILRTDSSPDAIYYAPFLFHNYMCLVAHGKPEAFLS